MIRSFDLGVGGFNAFNGGEDKWDFSKGLQALSDRDEKRRGASSKRGTYEGAAGARNETGYL